MQRELLISKVHSELEQEGFSPQQCLSTQSCFDLAARREFLLLVKILENIDGMTPEHADSLKRASAILSGQDFLVGERTARYPLENGVLYERHEVPASNLPTFKNILADEQPRARKFRKLTTAIDGKKLAQERSKGGLSLAQLSSLSKISVETLYRYEHSITSATVQNMQTLERLFRSALSKPVQFPDSRAKVRTFDFHGFESVRVNSPFEIVGKAREKSASGGTGEPSARWKNHREIRDGECTGKRDIVAFGFEHDLRTARKRAALYSNLSGVLDAYFCFIMRKFSRDSIEDIPVIRRDELSEIDKPRELVKLIRERGN